MSSKITVKDNGARALLAQMRRNPKVLDVGVIGDEATEMKVSEVETDEPITVAQQAAQAEFGIEQPQRSWLRDWVTPNERDIQRKLKRIAIRVIKMKGKFTIDQGLEILGAEIKGGIQERIASGIAPPNAEITIEKKGSDKPLINTGQFWSSITYALRSGS